MDVHAQPDTSSHQYGDVRSAEDLEAISVPKWLFMVWKNIMRLLSMQRSMVGGGVILSSLQM
jgi:hypothetical protein